MTSQLRPALIVDVDGTLCDVSGIRHYVTDPKRRDFEAFHAASALCPPVPGTLAWVEEHRAAGDAILVVTARQQRFEHITRRWLRKWGVRIDGLWMRANGDMRPDGHVKAEILAGIRTNGYRVTAAIDDNPNVIAVWEAAGIPTTLVPGWPA